MEDSNFIYEVNNRWGYVTVVLDNNGKKVFPFTSSVHLHVVFEEKQGEQNGKEERAIQTIISDYKNMSSSFDNNLMVMRDQPVVKQEIEEIGALFSDGTLRPSNLKPLGTVVTSDAHEKKYELLRCLLSSYHDQGKGKSDKVAERLNAENPKELSDILEKSKCIEERVETKNARLNHDGTILNRQGNCLPVTDSSHVNSEKDLLKSKDIISCPRRSGRICRKSLYGNFSILSETIPELVRDASKSGKNCSERKFVQGFQPFEISDDSPKPGLFNCQLCDRLFKYKLSFQKHNAWHKQQIRKRKQKQSCKKNSRDISENMESRVFRCEICYRLFKYKLSFQKHMSQHNNKKSLKEIKTSQNDVEDLSVDISENGKIKESEIFNCKICDRLFKYELSFEKHMTRHEEKEEEAQNAVKDQTDDTDISENGNIHEQLLKGHNLRPRNLHCSYVNSEGEGDEDEDGKEIPTKEVQKSSKKKAVFCGECNEVFATQFKYKCHQKQVHGVEYDYPCRICGDTFKTLHLLKTHRKTQHNNRRQECVCRVCGFVSGSLIDIKKHERTHGILCYFCNETFHRPGHMARHLREKHMDDVNEKGEKLVKKCTHCIRVFLSEKRLQKHMSSHGGIKTNICFKCGRMFNTRSSLNSHIANLHNPTAPSHVCCEICGAHLSNKKSLGGHMIQVHGKKTYKCSYCPKAFVNANKLSLHIRTHTREKPYICELCGKGCCQRYNLTIHMRSHSHVKPFSCEVCGLNFAYKCSLQSHQKIKHHLPQNCLDRRV